MTLQAQYNNIGYKNWLRACLGLKYLKEGILDFVDDEVKKIHASIVTKFCGVSACNQCGTTTLTDRRHPQPCPNNVCDNIRREIENQHRFNRPCWQNTDATKWCTDHWEIGKCFMSPGYTSVSTATETDCTGLLSVCINGMFLPPTITAQIIKPSGQPGGQTNIFHKNRDARNALLHSGSMSISDAERQDYIDDMIKLLANYKTPVDLVTQDAIDNLNEVSDAERQDYIDGMIKLLTNYNTPVDHVTQDAIDKLNEVNSVDIDIVPALELALLQTKLDAMTMRQTQLEEHIQDQSTECGHYKGQMQNTASALMTLGQRLDDLHKDSGKDITELQNTCTTLQNRIEQFHKRLFEVENRLDDMQITVRDNTTEIKDMKTTVKDNTTDIEDMKITVKDNTTDIEDMKITVKDNMTEMNDMKNTVKENTTDIRDVKITVNDYISEMNDIDNVVQNNTSDIDDMKITVRDNTSKINAIRKGVDARCADRNHEPGIKDVQDFLIAKYKHDASDVPMSPILRTHCVHVDEIYTELIIRDDLVHKPDTKPDTKADIEVEDKEPNMYVKTYQDVLYDGQTHCKNIFVVGKAGIGKTTWCRKLVATWVNTMENRGEKQANNKNESILREYDFVFYIALRHAKTDCHIIQMIEHQLFPHKPELLAKVQTLLNNPEKSARCMVILDGLDEWSVLEEDLSSDGIPVRDPTWESSIITTTRSWKLEEIQLGTNKIDRAVEIHGLEEDGTNKLIDHVVSGLNKNTGQNKMASEFRSQVSKSVNACMQVPLLLTIFVCLWFDGVQINKHLAGTFTELMEMLIRCAEGDKRKRLFQKISSQKLAAMKRKWNTENHSHPKCLSVRHLFVTYLPFLYRLGKLAFNALFSKRMTTTLVFDYQTIESILSEDELELSVKVGILSQTTHPGSALKQEFRLSFLHKTVQEYLAALYMVSGDNKTQCLNRFKSYCNKTLGILEMENVLLFISGLCPETAGQISCYIAEMEPDKRIHQLLLRCWRESQAVSNTSTEIYIKHHFLHPSSGYLKHNEDTLSYLRNETVRNTSLYITNISEREFTQRLDLTACRSLKTLHCEKSSVQALVPNSLEELKIRKYRGSTMLDLSGCQSLKKLHYEQSSADILVPDSLENANIDGFTGTTDSVVDLSACHSLRKLHYTNSNAQILVSDSLEEVNICGYTGSRKWVLDLSKCKSLRTLRFEKSSVRIVVSDGLQDVTVNKYTGPASWVLDLSGCQSLRSLHYSWSSVPILVPNSLEEVIINKYTASAEGLLDLSGCQSLRKLQYIVSSPCILVPNSLEEVEISGYTRPGETVLDLSGCQSLKALHYSWSNAQIQVPNSLKEVTIKKYTGSTKWVLDLSRCQSLKSLQYSWSTVQVHVPSGLEEVTIDGYRAKDSDSIQWSLDLSGCQVLRTLLYNNSTVRLHVPNSLKEVTINEYKGSTEWNVDFSECLSLRKLVYKGSSVQILVPNSVEELVIDEYTGHNGSVLDLSGCQSLRTLHYSWSTGRILVPPSLEEVDIEGYTGPTQWVLDMSGCLSLRTLRYRKSSLRIIVPNSLEEVTIDEYTESTTYGMLDFSECQSLRTLHYASSSAQLLVPSSLEEVSINKFKGPTKWVLDLSGCESLRSLSYTDSDVRILVPSSMEKLNIDGYTGSTASVLDLSGCQSLRALFYTGSFVPIRLPARDIESLKTDHSTHQLIHK